jgi:hypothetical protein
MQVRIPPPAPGEKRMATAKKPKKRVLPFEAYKGYLSADERKAIGVLESEGWILFVDVKIDESGEKDGKRRRTFRNEGRYNLALTRKRVKS